MMKIPERIRYLYRIKRAEPRRYANLLKAIFEDRSRRILEIGVYDGVHASWMIDTAAIFHPRGEIEYTGFDLFELLTEEKFREEFSVRPSSADEVRRRLEKTGARITLYKGDSTVILPRERERLGKFDLIFIDGGHSVRTISSDWNAVRELMHAGTAVIFDDYYTNPSTALAGMGCNGVIDGIDRNLYEVRILDPKDVFLKSWGSLEINFVKVSCK